MTGKPLIPRNDLQSGPASTIDVLKSTLGSADQLARAVQSLPTEQLREAAAYLQGFRSAAPIASIDLPTIGRLVRAAREQTGRSQGDFAALAGVGRRFLSELENGKPTLEIGKVFQVLNACGIDLYARKR